ncbi:hypothetical protein KC678_03455 [Candidatus Dojkabacteria bacterium]|uniref:Uncharacterized protein n=1 Tax=Candidatus Dojkabacteria bacterium TaxID=2099670 RepID=A0A955RG96_9BACT|nr:hypothetical protein [Candidatus Dojkabacteria bacterium]
MNSKQIKQGQILLITLLVLMVLAIVIVGVVIVTSRDTSQVVANQKYEQLLNVAEVELQRVIDKYGDTTIPLDDLSRDDDLDNYVTSCDAVNSNSQIGYECKINDDNALGLDLDTTITVVEDKNISGLELYKDDTITFALDGYNQGLDITWDQDIAMEIAITYFEDLDSDGVWDTNEPLDETRDIFDAFGVYDSLGGTPNFNFVSLNGGRGARFTINNIADLQSINYQTTSISLTARTRNNLGNPTLIDVTATDPGSFPFQIRSFTTSVFDPNDPQTPVAEVESFVSIETQLDSIFNYTIITDGNITL